MADPTKEQITPAAWAELVAGAVVDRLANEGMTVPDGNWSQISEAVRHQIAELWSLRP